MPSKSRTVKRRRRHYRSEIRAEGAAETRQRILEAARARFITQGYAAMTMQNIADDAEVALDTVYETVGRKPELVKLLVEIAISNTDREVPAEQRAYVQRIHAATSAREKLAIYANAVADIHQRLAPLVKALESAAQAHPDLGAIWREIAERRAQNMKKFAAELVATGDVRAELDVAGIADVLWAMTAPEMYSLLVDQRGWSQAELEAWLADALARVLLRTRADR